MTYTAYISKEKTPKEFAALVRFVDSVRKIYELQYPKDILQKIRDEYQISIVMPSGDPGTVKGYEYPVHFTSEEDYVIFLLQWA